MLGWTLKSLRRTPTMVDRRLAEPRGAALGRNVCAGGGCDGNRLRDARKKLGKGPHVAENNGENEWYTPLGFIEAARMAMGDIGGRPSEKTLDCDEELSPTLAELGITKKTSARAQKLAEAMRHAAWVLREARWTRCYGRALTGPPIFPLTHCFYWLGD